MKRITLTAFLSFIPTLAFAWGNLGHETVCAIAYGELTDKARESVDRLQKEESDNRYPTFWSACTWPDSHIPETDKRRKEHFINWVRSWPAVEEAECQSDLGCLFEAIPGDRAKVADAALSAADRWIGLKYLGHWLGDIHQPLHVAFADDFGGNEIDVSHDLGCTMNLHAVWDTCSVNHLMKLNGFDADENDIAAFAALLRGRVSPEERENWLVDSRMLTWAIESYGTTRQAGTRYCVLEGNTCQYTKTEVSFSHDQAKKQLDLDDSYLEGIEDLVARRLSQAGVRLGYLLNTLFEKETGEENQAILQ